MFSKVLPRSTVSVLGFVFVISIFIGLSASVAMAEDWDMCGNNDEFTSEFRLEDCEFINKGENPFFILKPGYQVVLESEDEKSVETVLDDTKWIDLDGRKIKTRVVEERAYEFEVDEETGEVEEKLIEISLNWFAICKKTNTVYYFGEWSRDCEDGFDENDECDDENNAGSWEAGLEGAQPGIMMPGTFLLGAKYFQEVAPPMAADRGEHVDMGLTVETEAGTFRDCVEVIDTNPVEGGDACGEEDSKLYCPGIGLVQDQELVLVDYGYIDDDDDDDKSWRRRHHHRWH